MRTLRLLVVTLPALLLMSGCFKLTGGGWLLDEDGDLVTFGLNAQPDGEPTGFCDGFLVPFPDIPTCQPAKGRITLIDHGNVSGERFMLKGEFTGTFNPEFDPDNIQETGSQFNGTGTFNGEAYDIGIRVTDNGSGAGQIEGDFIFLFLQPQGGGPERVYIGEIGGGNITVHSR